MRYTLTSVSGPARRVFKEGVTYDDRGIVRVAAKEGFRVTRPNRSERVRGSSRLVVWRLDRIVARFERATMEESRTQAPTPVATIRGLI